MKLILRKNDSSTSLILFVYNMVLTKTTQDSIKLSSLLKVLMNFDKSESSIRMSLSRSVKAGVLERTKTGNEVSYSLTQLGKESIHYWNEGARNYWARFALRQSEWDEKWHCIVLDFSKEEPKERVKLTDGLGQLGYVNVSGNTWINPYYRKQELQDLLPMAIRDHAIEMHGEIQVPNGIRAFSEYMYQLEELKIGYERFIEKYGGMLEEIKKAGNAPSEGGTALSLLYWLGQEFYTIASEDAALPKKLLPVWIGDTAAMIMKELRSILDHLSWEYLKKFI